LSLLTKAKNYEEKTATISPKRIFAGEIEEQLISRKNSFFFCFLKYFNNKTTLPKNSNNNNVIS